MSLEFVADLGIPESGTGVLSDRVAYIRTSDRIAFRRCRRKFDWNYVHRGNLTKDEARGPLWFGTLFHYAMEDYHGHRYFDTPSDAFQAAVLACRRTRDFRLPNDWEELLELGEGMCGYYQEWLRHRDPLVTLEIGGVPQVEVNFQIPLEVDQDLLARAGFDRCVYTGTIDRVVLDDEGRIWPVDYKTAKTIQDSHLDTDPQISAYMWAASKIYNLPVAGFIYQQHRKVVGHEPAFLAGSKSFSVAKNQVTTHALYKNALEKLYGTVEKAPNVNVQFLNWLAGQEDQRRDYFIQRDFIERNEAQIANEGIKILMEAYELLDPDLPMYPNPTRDCSWDCDFQMACIALDSNLDWTHELEVTTTAREEDDKTWRNQLQDLYPQRDISLPRLHLQHRNLRSRPSGAHRR